MLRFACLLAFVACALAGTIPVEEFPELDGKIVGGTATTIQAHPYQVSLQKNGNHFCGGSLYKSNVVVTAAHCLQNGIAASSITVRLGSTSRSSGGVVVKAASYKNHPSYSGSTHAYDIAIIRLASSVSLSSTIKTIALASSTPAAGTSAVVTGWGTTKEGASTLPTTLQQLTVKMLSNTQCSSSSYGYGSKIKPSMVCAYNAGKDSCQGDSGGPLVAGGKLVGVVSWGYGCARVGYPGVYADVAALKSWVEANA
ncbi:epsilonTry.2 family protein [Megaselia abdita]